MRRKTKLILLAEDEDAHKFLFGKAVSHLPLDVKIIHVVDGVELMDYVSNPYNSVPDLVFLDINMPRKNGLECLKEIREMDYYRDIPLVIYTTSDEESDRLAAMEYEASLYLIKDGDMRSLIRILLLLLTENNGVEQLKYHYSGLQF